MRCIVLAGLLVGGLIHLLPMTGALGPDKLRALYGLQVEDPT